MPSITVSASYGAGGSIIAPALAERLGARFVDRAIPLEVARRLRVPIEHALDHDECAPPRFGRLISAMAPLGGMYIPEEAGQALVEEDYQRETERLIREAVDDGDAVILGRGAALVLRDRPDVLHVRLDGPKEARIAAATLGREIDEHEARERLKDADRSRELYVRHFYGADARDPHHYHLVLNSTRLSHDACVEIVLAAVRALEER